MADTPTFQPNDRYAIVGKTGSGKTQFAATLATTIVGAVNEEAIDRQTEERPPPFWSLWWVDSKGDPKDIARLRDWGYVRVKSLESNNPNGPELYRYFKLERQGDEENVAPQVAEIARAAYERSRKGDPTVLLIDEWAQAVFSSRRMGPRLLDIEQRGRGNRCGLIGLTQEPVDIPRQLLSQASHLFIFDLTFERDAEYMRDYCSEYEMPSDMGHPHGFWYRHIDGRSGWHFFIDERDFYDWLKGVEAA